MAKQQHPDPAEIPTVRTPIDEQPAHDEPPIDDPQVLALQRGFAEALEQAKGDFGKVLDLVDHFDERLTQLHEGQRAQGEKLDAILELLQAAPMQRVAPRAVPTIEPVSSLNGEQLAELAHEYGDRLQKYARVVNGRVATAIEVAAARDLRQAGFLTPLGELLPMAKQVLAFMQGRPKS